MRRVAITGLALASPFGRGLDEFWAGVCHGPARTRSFEPAGFGALARQVARLPAGMYPEIFDTGVHAPTVIATDLVRRALTDAGHACVPEGTGLALGSHFAETDFFMIPPRPVPAPMLATVARECGLFGPVVNTPIACAAGNLSMTFGFDRVREGDAPVMVAGGFDLIGLGCVGAFALFDNLTDTSPKPFSPDRDGFLLGEGGAMFVLEDMDAARARGARIFGELCGAAAGHDAAHPTRPASDGRGLKRAITQALREAGLETKDVGYVNAHSPGTEANDPAEAAAYRDVFGARGVPVSSTKAAHGHAQGGANALEALVCLLALKHQLLPPTLNVAAPDPAFEIDLVVGKPRPTQLNYAVSAASGMGGASAALVFGKGTESFSR